MTGWDAPRLEAYARELAAAPGPWRHLVAPDPAQRTYELLHHDDEVMAWLICWLDDHDTGFHDHDGSSGAVAVVEGAVREERLRLGSAPLERVARAGQSFTFSAADIHRVRHEAGRPAITIHAYSPPLWRMGSYEVAEGGALRRHSISYAEELRPRTAA